MLKPLELSLFPSCTQALAWSSEGELAVASGEHVQILTPKPAGTTDPDQDGKDAWDSVRVRVNVFTNAEWALILPQSRDNFSIGVEQSTSHIIGLAWSPPGLGRFRRCLLAVLTANLMLSLWEPVGENGQWIRVAIVNHALYHDPGNWRGLQPEEIRRYNLRSFHWCDPLKVPSAISSQGKSDPESRWGVHLLAGATDNNELVMFRVRRYPKSQASCHPYCVEKVASHAVSADENLFPQPGRGTMLYKTLQARSRLLSISCGPWVTSTSQSTNSTYHASAMVGVTYGTRLRVFTALVALDDLCQEKEVTPRYEATAKFTEHPLGQLGEGLEHHRVTGPLTWLHTINEPNDDTAAKPIMLAVGVMGGVFTISVPLSIYNGSSEDKKDAKSQDWPFPDRTAQGTEDGESTVEPVSAFLALRDSHGARTFHVGTLGGLGECASINELGQLDGWNLPPWSKTVENLREQYDLDLDLGGETAVRIWGLASCHGLYAVLFTRHPTDMIEYRITSGERAMLAFGSADPNTEPNVQACLGLSIEERPQASEQREKVLSFLLSSEVLNNVKDQEDQKLIYAAACCAIVDSKTESIRSQARSAFEKLSTLSGADLSDEMSKCTLDPSSIEPRAQQHEGPAAHVFEKCEVCDSGMIWSSPEEAQCAEGHVFARCGLSFLAIQEPGVSKFCPVCRREFFDEELLTSLREGQVGQLFSTLFETYDDCLFCKNKFQSS